MIDLIAESGLEYIHQPLVDFIKVYGVDAFNSAVYHGAFQDVAFTYIHPSDELRTLEQFDTIFNAFVRAYV